MQQLWWLEKIIGRLYAITDENAFPPKTPVGADEIVVGVATDDLKKLFRPYKLCEKIRLEMEPQQLQPKVWKEKKNYMRLISRGENFWQSKTFYRSHAAKVSLFYGISPVLEFVKIGRWFGLKGNPAPFMWS